MALALRFDFACAGESGSSEEITYSSEVEDLQAALFIHARSSRGKDSGAGFEHGRHGGFTVCGAARGRSNGRDYRSPCASRTLRKPAADASGASGVA